MNDTPVMSYKDIVLEEASDTTVVSYKYIVLEAASDIVTPYKDLFSNAASGIMFSQSTLFSVSRNQPISHAVAG